MVTRKTCSVFFDNDVEEKNPDEVLYMIAKNCYDKFTLNIALVMLHETFDISFSDRNVIFKRINSAFSWYINTIVGTQMLEENLTF